ncbi:hypothetical protein SLEP1_g32471 [Rubroshorea leprosula]|uniref:Glycosyltransferase N-terminal domain-containing protein n=1 Tax=Rubroshorea leprosula TaxID=152421 RepID=A0AAV5KDF5_9ROSI|nr:hypothetical protein SLEP1_g32471 [Rubroshorea leprosula]
MMELLCSLSSSSIQLHVHYVSSSIHACQAKLRFSHPFLLSKIQFPELQLSPCPTNPNLPPSFESSMQFHQPLAALLQTLSSQAKKLVGIHATLMSYAVQDTASLPNAELCSFFYFSASVPFSLIEGDQIDLLACIDQGEKMRWAVGPLIQMICNHEENNSNNRKHKCLDWLDKQPPNSMIYVSFGTQSSMESKQIKELTIGLELKNGRTGDGVKRVDSSGGNIGHPLVGGFMSHYGWGSYLESVSMGVHIAAWPMGTDQPRNAAFVTRVLKVGLEVLGWSRREELATALSILEVVRVLMAFVEATETKSFNFIMTVMLCSSFLYVSF